MNWLKKTQSETKQNNFKQKSFSMLSPVFKIHHGHNLPSIGPQLLQHTPCPLKYLSAGVMELGMPHLDLKCPFIVRANFKTCLTLYIEISIIYRPRADWTFPGSSLLNIKPVTWLTKPQSEALSIFHRSLCEACHLPLVLTRYLRPIMSRFWMISPLRDQLSLLVLQSC